MMMLKDLSIEAFAGTVASDTAVPGGGSVAALAGALAAALTAMVARLTLKKEQFAQAASQMEPLRDDADQWRADLLAAVDRDAESYQQVLSALRLPKATAEQQQARRSAIQAAFKQAAQVPLQVAETALNVLALAGRAVANGNPDMITDAAVGAMMARTAALGALYNVKINLTALKDERYVTDMRRKVSALQARTIELEQEILGAIKL